ncbi:MAG TPA: M50 family metallopeptidase [Acidimicrobiales bacterium]|nr:M50 family metallopeptidase [Acidimicrobiales bacterium]
MTDPAEQRRAIGRLLLVVGAGVAAAVLTGTTGTLAVVLAIVIMIMLHELGHFATAKWGNMKVTEYFLGFGPRLWSIHRGETEYGVKAIPAGGYVKIIGMSNLEEVDPADEPRTYRQQSFGRRLSVALAGSAVHFILAFLILWVLFSFVGVPNSHKASIGGFTTIQGTTSPARQAGLQPGDVFVSVNGRAISSTDQLQSFIQNHAGQPVTIVVKRHGDLRTIRVTPIDERTVKVQGQAPLDSSTPYGIIGVQLTSPVETTNPVFAVGRSTTDLGRFSWETLQALGSVFSPHGISNYTHQVTSPTGTQSQTQANSNNPRLESPIGIVRLASQASHAGLREVLLLLFSINVFVGLFNLFPMLPLDGGHVAIAVYERARSRRGRRYHVDVAKLLPATYLVFLVLVVLGVTALYMDVTHPMANPFQ